MLKRKLFLQVMRVTKFMLRRRSATLLSLEIFEAKAIYKRRRLQIPQPDFPKKVTELH